MEDGQIQRCNTCGKALMGDVAICPSCGRPPNELRLQVERRSESHEGAKLMRFLILLVFVAYVLFRGEPNLLGSLVRALDRIGRRPAPTSNIETQGFPYKETSWHTTLR